MCTTHSNNKNCISTCDPTPVAHNMYEKYEHMKIYEIMKNVKYEHINRWIYMVPWSFRHGLPTQPSATAFRHSFPTRPSFGAPWGYGPSDTAFRHGKTTHGFGKP